MTGARNVLLAERGSELLSAQHRWTAAISWVSVTVVVALTLALLGLHSFLNSDYALGTNKPSSAGFTPVEVVGFAAWMYFFPISVALLTVATLIVLKHPRIPRTPKLVWLAVCFAACVASAVVASLLGREVLRCGVFWCQSTKPPAELDPTGLFNGMGLWILLVTVIMAPACLVAAWRTAAGGSPQELTPLARRVFMRQRHRRLAGACLAVVVIPACFFLSTVLPPTFSAMIVSGTKGNIPSYVAMKVSGAEVEEAWMRTQNIELSSEVVLKFYPDTMIYYGFLEVIAISSILAAALPQFGALLAKRCFRNFSVGECSLLCLFVCMLVLWFVYWLHDHSFERGKWHSETEKIARTLGMTAVLFMSLSLLPAAKNSLWLEALGISWESSVWVHRCLGGVCLLLVLAHVGAFWINFAALDIFPHDILAMPTFYPMNGPKPQEPQGDDWTIPMMQLIGYPSLLAMGLPQFWRRKHWELFKYFHYFFMALVPAALLHATSGWYFLLGSIAFWLVDASIRFASCARPTAVLSVAAHDAEGGVTEVRFEKSFKEPGQYCFVNVPEISLWEWHPFSLCSSPLDSSAQMCMTNMGNGTFTGKLYDLAKKCSERGSSFVLNVDGPYGPPLDPKDYSAMLLIAGGIGITPMHSIFRMLAQLADRQELPASLKLVRLIWIGRSASLFRILIDSLAECIRPGSIEAVLYTDDPAQLHESAGIESAHPGLQVLAERPSFENLYDTLLSNLNGEGRVLVKSCGPPTMDAAAERAVHGRRSFVYESELFVL
mmetsp:Transcript_165739/g.532171  ORF Transcript_165739/g.532171 Transcript_165739/m.532171 type:complete len:776 (+) Transcript_165739:55-2382(+)|eukprot:CAMPEP_0203895790 /NCGR_PEP_ID=MMETSP0359-20131031/38601_1 /ASSEMBLY_ACC=CAM_ASM_000338 /TAXON_ID=268821 /ORGANISM="Scrippsiella Hangoei, Strain SHTV-5" /LENGTH=775 /DNA_ID=CAMNT_0050818335 /DNA_START=31 /DNA_END=2358 /DNA_ORIENTATION=-